MIRVGLHLWYMFSYQLQLECMDPSSVSTVGSLSDSMNDKQQNIMSNANEPIFMSCSLEIGCIAKSTVKRRKQNPLISEKDTQGTYEPAM